MQDGTIKLLADGQFAASLDFDDAEADVPLHDRIRTLIAVARELSDACADLADALRPLPGNGMDDPLTMDFSRLRAERTAALLDEAASATRGTLGLLGSAYTALGDEVAPGPPADAESTADPATTPAAIPPAAGPPAADPPAASPPAAGPPAAGAPPATSLAPGAAAATDYPAGPPAATGPSPALPAATSVPLGAPAATSYPAGPPAVTVSAFGLPPAGMATNPADPAADDATPVSGTAAGSEHGPATEHAPGAELLAGQHHAVAGGSAPAPARPRPADRPGPFRSPTEPRPAQFRPVGGDPAAGQLRRPPTPAGSPPPATSGGPAAGTDGSTRPYPRPVGAEHSSPLDGSRDEPAPPAAPAPAAPAPAAPAAGWSAPGPGPQGPSRHDPGRPGPSPHGTEGPGDPRPPGTDAPSAAGIGTVSPAMPMPPAVPDPRESTWPDAFVKAPPRPDRGQVPPQRPEPAGWYGAPAEPAAAASGGLPAGELAEPPSLAARPQETPPAGLVAFPLDESGRFADYRGPTPPPPDLPAANGFAAGHAAPVAPVPPRPPPAHPPAVPPAAELPVQPELSTAPELPAAPELPTGPAEEYGTALPSIAEPAVVVAAAAPGSSPAGPEHAGLAVLARQVEAARRHLQAAVVVAHEQVAHPSAGGLLAAVEQVLDSITELARSSREALPQNVSGKVFPGEARFLCSIPWEHNCVVAADPHGAEPAGSTGLCRLLVALGYDAQMVTGAAGSTSVQVRTDRYAAHVALVEPAGGGRQRWSGALEWVDGNGTTRTWAETLGPVELDEEELARRVDELLRRCVGPAV